MHPDLRIDKFPVQAEALGPSKWTREPEMPRTDQFGLDRFGPVGVSWVKPVPCGWHAPPAPCPWLIEHFTPKGELGSSYTVGRGQGCLSEVFLTHMAVAPLLCKAELSTIS